MRTREERPEEELLNAALRLLATRSRGVEEMRERLLKKGFPAGDVSKCLTWLKERDLLNDRAFARALIRDRLNFSPRGSLVLERELARKGIGRTLAAETVEEVLEEEGLRELDLAEAAARGWVRRQGEKARRALVAPRFSEEREKARRRLYAFLGRRGFRGEAARRGIEAGSIEAAKINSEKD